LKPGEQEVVSIMNGVKKRFYLWAVTALWILVSSFWGCASKNVRMGSLKFKGNGYEKLLQKQMARSSAETPTPDKFPKMTDEDHERLGDSYFRQGNLERAFMQYEKALRLNPNETGIRYKEGLVFLAKGINGEAIEAFQEVLKKEPHHALAHEGIGQAFFKMGRFGEAKRHFQRALKGNPELWRAHNFLGIIHDYEKRPEAAIDEYQAAIALKPDEGLLYNNLGISYSLIGENEKAVAAFREALKTRASYRRIYNNLGLVLSKLERYQEALEAFRRGGNEAQAYNNLGCAYFHQGEHDKAVRSFEKAMELAPTFYAKASENLEKARLGSLYKASLSREYSTNSPENSIELTPERQSRPESGKCSTRTVKKISSIAEEEEVRQFLEHYRERYSRKDLEGFLSLFSPKAVQNQGDGFEEIKKIYSTFFDKSQELRFHMDDTRIDISQDAAKVRARYEVDQVLKKRRKKKVWKGDIQWILVREDGALRISSLDYRRQKSPQ
jgi:Flp pilus assembly protein TadD